MDYFENLTLPDITCPPPYSFKANGEQVYFRVLKHKPATSECFLPTPPREGKPKPDACIAKAVSLSNSLDGLIHGFFKTPAHKKKQKLIGILKLTPKDGMLKQTFAPAHYSWWRSKAFSPETVTIQTVEA